MKLNNNFLIHDTGNGEILIPVGEETKKFHGVIKLNEMGSVIVHLIENDDLSLEEILEHIYDNYEGDPEVVKSSVESFIKTLKESHAVQ